MTLHRRVNKDDKIRNVKLIDFKLEVADALFRCNTIVSSQRGRHTLESLLEEKRRKPNAQKRPPKDIILDIVDHMSTMDKKVRCMLPNSSARMQYTFMFNIRKKLFS